MKALKLLGVLAGAALLLPAGANAATLTNDGGTLTYTAAPGAASAVGFAEVVPPSTTVDVYRFLTNPNGPPDDDPITSMPATCTPDQDTADLITYRCTGVTKVVANTGDGDDQVDAGDASEQGTLLASIEIELHLGEGDDFAAGGQSDDTLNGDDGNDTLFLDGFGEGPSAGTGNDTGVGGAGNDAVFGGRGNDGIELGEGQDHGAGGPGTDEIQGGGGDDDLAGGPGADDLRGQAGNDTLTGECEGQPCPAAPGGDDVTGGEGFDLFRYESYAPDTVSIRLDDANNDGASGEGDNVHADVEDVQVTGPADATVTGSARFNSLTTGSGTDTLNSQDGTPDRVSCGDGTDTANVDDVDVVNENDCETVNRATTGYNDDKAPVVAWSAPASGARLSTTAPNTLSATASDDKGIARVDFLDDERTVCSDTAAPYTCDYRPQGDDVGRNTLVAIAVDTSGQTASAVRAVVVPRFAGRLSARTTPRRDTRAPYRFTTTGRLTLPAGVTPAQGCRGTVKVQIKAGRKAVSTRRVKLRSNCTYRSRVTFRLKARLRPRTLRRSVRFGGNAVMAARSARRQTLRVGS